MRLELFFFVIAMFASAGFAFADEEESVRESESALRFFHESVGPILREKCFRCHGPAKAVHPRFEVKDWVLDYIASDGRIQNSSLWTSHLAPKGDDSEIMPPTEENNPLSEDQLMVLRKWIEMQAPYSIDFDWYQPVQQSLKRRSSQGGVYQWLRTIPVWVPGFVLLVSVLFFWRLRRSSES